MSDSLDEYEVLETIGNKTVAKTLIEMLAANSVEARIHPADDFEEHAIAPLETRPVRILVPKSLLDKAKGLLKASNSSTNDN